MSCNVLRVSKRKQSVKKYKYDKEKTHICIDGKFVNHIHKISVIRV